MFLQSSVRNDLTINVFFFIGILTSIPILVAHDAPSNLKVRVMGLGESVDNGDSWMFQNTSDSINVQRLGLNIFIQTDRPIYKPGQTSKYILDVSLNKMTRNHFLAI